MEEFDFETEFTSDEEVLDAMDSVIVTVGEIAEKEDQRTAIVNPYRLKQIQFVYASLKYLLNGTDARVEYKLHSPYKSVGSVSAIGRNLTLTHPDWFVRMAELASNVDIYPKTDGTVKLDFTFHGLTIPLGD